MSVDQRLHNSFGLWFSLVGAPFVWAAHFMIMWAITEMGCRLGVADSRILGIYAAHLLAVISTLITLALISVSGLTAFRRWKELRADAPSETLDASSPVARTQFMNVLGMLFSTLFAVTVIYMVVPVFVLPLCASVR